VLTYAAILVLLLLLSAWFSSSETAFLSLQRTRLAHLVEQRVPGARRVAGLLDRPRSLLSAILLGNNLVNTAAAAVGTAIATELFSEGGSAIIVATLAVTLLLVLFGEIGPKSIALSQPFTLSRLYALPMAGWVRLTRPATWALDRLGDSTLRLLGGSEDEQAGAMTAAELRTAIRHGARLGALESAGASQLLGALTIQSRQAQEIMVPRVDIVSADADAPLREAAERLARSGFLRLPVYEGSPDEVVGFLHVSDLHALQLRPADFATRRVRDVMRPVQYESEHATIQRILDVMREHASYLVMLVDEFGSTSGMITLEDIMEEVVGELRSESGHEEEEAPVLPDARRVVDGGMLLVDLSHDLDVDFTEIEANTVAGLLLAITKRFPERGEAIDHRGYRFTVVDRDERRITRVAVEPSPEDAA
jgi:putative hemolysin